MKNNNDYGLISIQASRVALPAWIVISPADPKAERFTADPRLIQFGFKWALNWLLSRIFSVPKQDMGEEGQRSTISDSLAVIDALTVLFTSSTWFI